MKLKLLSLTIILCITANAFADDPITASFKKNIVSPYENFFSQKRERVYVHFNRSEYIAGDNIWFKAYIFEPKTKHPMLATNKLYAELFDQDGKLVTRKILFAINGVTSSFFKLGEKVKGGNYTIRAYTNWMRNFNDQPLFSSVFKIHAVGSAIAADTTPSENQLKTDIQVFPEGGMFVEGIDNHFGVKLTSPDGHGAKLSGYVVDTNNDTLQTFVTNHLGFGDFTISAAKKIKYRIVVKDGLSKQEISIPEPVERGLGMMVNTLFPNKIAIAVNTNSQTAAALQDQAILIMVHNNGEVFKSSYFKIKDSAFVTTIPKSMLGPGVNYITLFGPDFKPLSERLIFNNLTTSKGIVKLEHSLKTDSLSLDITTTDAANALTPASLSLSVLPLNTTGNHFSNSLQSDILLGSAVKGNIEASHYYIESNDLTHQKDLDNLLLTQGWRRYEWPDILTGKGVTEKYPFETGFIINAISENSIKGKGEKDSRLTLFSPENNLVLSSEVDEQGHASFKNVFLADSTHLLVSAVNLKGSGSNRNIKASIKYWDLDSAVAVSRELSPQKNPDVGLTKPLTAGMIELEEVVITAQKDANPFLNSMYSSPTDDVHVITKENYLRYNSIEQLLQNKFFLNVSRNEMGDSLMINMGRGTSETPTLVIDGAIMSDLSYLALINISDVEAVAVNKTGALFGINGAGGSINIITRKKPLDLGDAGITNTRSILIKGYTRYAEFYTPKYILSPESTTFQKFASIYWKPDLNTDSTGKGQIRFRVPKELQDFTIRIEGISPNGTVYFDSRKISTKPEL